MFCKRMQSSFGECKTIVREYKCLDMKEEKNAASWGNARRLLKNVIFSGELHSFP